MHTSLYCCRPHSCEVTIARRCCCLVFHMASDKLQCLPAESVNFSSGLLVHVLPTEKHR